MAKLVRVASLNEIPPGTSTCVETDGRRIALFNSDGTLHAIDDTCPHRGGPLSQGKVADGCVTCPWHGAVFQITTGERISGPARRGVRRYVLQVDGQDIQVEIPSAFDNVLGADGTALRHRTLRVVGNRLLIGAVATLAVGVWLAHAAVGLPDYVRRVMNRRKR